VAPGRRGIRPKVERTPLRGDLAPADDAAVVSPTATSEEDEFAAWLPAPVFSVPITVSQQHGQWYAEALDFGVAGMGKSKAAAERDLNRLVHAYLDSCFLDGRSYEEALRPRPVPRSLRLLTGAYWLVHRAVVRRLPGRNGELVLSADRRVSGPGHP
jgi:hypothetical protein